MPRVEKNVETRFEQGTLHDARSERCLSVLRELDKDNDFDSLITRMGSAEVDYFTYLLDIYFEMQDIK